MIEIVCGVVLAVWAVEAIMLVGEIVCDALGVVWEGLTGEKEHLIDPLQPVCHWYEWDPKERALALNVWRWLTGTKHLRVAGTAR